MWIESVNRVYGRTRNAYDPHRTAGGSSGGEGAAVGSGGSPVGLGSDIGGSIRVPAFFNGVFGHKPSPGLVPNTGQFPSTEGEAAYMLTLGPLTRHAEDLMPVTRIIAGPDGVDERCVARELGDPAAVDFAKLRVLLADDASLLPARKELREARDPRPQALEERGARCERVSLKQLRRALEIYLAALGDGAGTSLNELLEDAGVQPRGARPWMDAVRGSGDHTVPILITLALERLNRHMPAAARRRRSPPPASCATRSARSSATTRSCSTSPTRGSRRDTAARSAAPGSSRPPRSSTCSASRSPRCRSGSTRRACRSASRSPPPTATTTSPSPPRWRSSSASAGGCRPPSGVVPCQAKDSGLIATPGFELHRSRGRID